MELGSTHQAADDIELCIGFVRLLPVESLRIAEYTMCIFSLYLAAHSIRLASTDAFGIGVPELRGYADSVRDAAYIIGMVLQRESGC